MLKRTFSTLLLWVIVVSVLYFLGATGGILLLTILALATQWEFYQLLQKAGQKTLPFLGLAGGLCIFLAPFIASQTDLSDNLPFELSASGFLVLFVTLSALFALREKAKDRLPAFLGTSLGLLYVPFLLHYLVELVLLPADPSQGLFLAVWVIAVVKFTDVGAYLTGSLCGKNKMAPSLSPGKTWEGAIGGVALSALLGFLLVQFGGDLVPAALAPWQGALFALPLAILSIPSDLLESLFKRAANAKDSGTFIPGIGGAYDLTDSLLLTAPLSFFLIQIVL
ncbi:MAG: phosphatidate cytidylyltransferase [Opitutales bacterium]|nr:phosphatidate cytidylyltransferase [Opitutales bacterium]MCH8540648.1 phosphatidate cytidylyltransferase [Opitutales bacterium]